MSFFVGKYCSTVYKYSNIDNEALVHELWSRVMVLVHALLHCQPKYNGDPGWPAHRVLAISGVLYLQHL
jgi:hypothetical protein